jgi:steroid delta-isomerase-like uncharacterized protein
MSADNKAVIRRLYNDVWNKRNLAAIDEIISPSHALYEPDAYDSRVGPAAYRATAERFLRGIPDLRFTVQEVISEGNKFVVVWVVTGTHQGEFYGVPATNKKLSLEGITIHQIKNGKIFDSYVSWDELGMMRQVGAVPPRQKTTAGGARGS